MNIICFDTIHCKIKKCIENKNKLIVDDKICRSKLLFLIKKMNLSNSTYNRITIFIDVLVVIYKYQHLIFSNIPEWISFTVVLQQKLKEFSKEEKLKKDCEELLKKYFDDICRGYTRRGIRCKNHVKKGISNKFCGVHINFSTKVKKILCTELPNNISNICINLIF